jgi:hypothetical protein
MRRDKAKIDVAEISVGPALVGVLWLKSIDSEIDTVSDCG